MTLASDDKVLILFRHAKADQVAGKPAHERALTRRG
jgi:phosphohistidine phosphatase